MMNERKAIKEFELLELWMTAEVALPLESIEAIIEQEPDALDDFKNTLLFFENQE